MDIRINVRRLLRSLWFSFILPMGSALLLDWWLGFFPWLTIGAIIVVIPLATVLVIRTALSEIDIMIQELAPLEPTPNDQHEIG